MWMDGNASNASRIDVTFVLGMHRSGTSAITRSMKALGMELGDSHLPAVANDNDRGYWEDTEIQNICERALQQVGSRWNSLTPIPVTDLRRLCETEIFVDAATRLKSLLSAGGPIAVKNPRLCKLSPFWTSVTNSLGVSTGFVIAVRNPLSVAYSLTRNGLRGDIPKFLGFKLWLSYLTGAVIATEHYPRVFVDFDTLMAHPQRELLRMAKVLAFPPPSSEAVKDYANGFLTEELRHSRFTLSELTASPAVDADVKQAYELLLQASTLEPGAAAPAKLQAFFDKLSKKDVATRHTWHFIDDRESKLATLRSTVHTLEQEAGSHKGLLDAIEQSRLSVEVLNQRFADDSVQAQALVKDAVADVAQRLTQGLALVGTTVDARSVEIAAAISTSTTSITDTVDSLRQSVANQLIDLAPANAIAGYAKDIENRFEQLDSQWRAFFARELSSMASQFSMALQTHARLMDSMRSGHEQAILLERQRSTDELVLARQQLSDTLAGHEQWMERTRGDHEQALQQERQRSAEELALARQQLSDTIAGHEQLMERTRGEHAQTLLLDRQRSAEELALVRQQLSDTIAGHEQWMERTRSEHAQAVQLERQRSDEELALARRQLSDTLLGHGQFVEQLRSEHAESSKRADEEIAHARQQMTDLARSHEQAIDAMRADQAAQAKRADQRHAAAMTELRQLHDEALDAAQRQGAESLTRVEAELREARQASIEGQKQRERDLAQMKQEHRAAMDQLRREHAAALALMEARLADQQVSFEMRLRDHGVAHQQQAAAHAIAVHALQQNQTEMLKEQEQARRAQTSHFEKQVALLGERHLAEMARLDAMAKAELMRLRDDHAAGLRRLEESSKAQSQVDGEKIAALEQSLERIRAWKGFGLIARWNKGDELRPA